MILDLRKLQQRLEKNEPGPLYLLVGDEDFLVMEAVNVLRHKTVDVGTADFNCDVFDAGEVSAGQVKDAVEMLPMASPRRLVVYRGVDRLGEKDWEVLAGLFEDPVSTTTFVLVAESLDKRKRAFKRISDAGVVVELKRPYENQLGSWIDYLGYRLGLSVSPEAIHLLKQFIGTNLTELHNELVKLRDFLGGRDRVDAADVLQVVSQTRVDRIFDLTDAIGRRDKVHALHSLANLLEHGQSEVGVLAMIGRHFRILANLRDGQKDGLSGPRLANQAGIPQFLLTSYLEQARLWDEPKIRRTFEVLEDTDRALKSSAVPSHVWLENFVLKTCS